MQVNDIPSIDPNVDYTKILPIQQKRTIAFINHFVMNTVSFLNKFAQSCESRLMEFEYKLHRVEASLMILESQLASIPHLDDSLEAKNLEPVTEEKVDLDLPPLEADEQMSEDIKDEATAEAVDLSHDPIYQRFYKMIQFGVPPAAVKLKMQTEGLDPSILDSIASK